MRPIDVRWKHVRNTQLTSVKNNMEEIDEMLNKWIYNSIIRKQLRDLIIKELNKDESNRYE